jgi:hypothetical protein
MSNVTSLTGVNMSYAKESMKDVIRFEAGLAMVKYVDYSQITLFLVK